MTNADMVGIGSTQEVIQVPIVTPETHIRSLRDAVLLSTFIFDVTDEEDRINQLTGWTIDADGEWKAVALYAIMPRLSDIATQLAPQTREFDALVFCIDSWSYPPELTKGLTQEQMIELSRRLSPSEHPDRVGSTAVIGLQKDGSTLTLYKLRGTAEASLGGDMVGTQMNALRYMVGLP